LAELGLGTVCESALCPNLNECFSRKHAAFLILGDACTRACGFCSVRKSAPQPPDPSEPLKVSEAVKRLGLDYAVITSVTRDDLPDGGANQFVKTIGAIRLFSPTVKIEVLVPDFGGEIRSIEAVLDAGPDVFGHNIETVRRLYPIARPEADYARSLELLKFVKALAPRQVTKAGIMLGLGEAEEEVIDTFKDIRRTGCDILTIGQYLRPRAGNLPVRKFYAPEEFERYRRIGEKELGFRYAASGPFVRSSYQAEEIFEEII